LSNLRVIADSIGKLSEIGKEPKAVERHIHRVEPIRDCAAVLHGVIDLFGSDVVIRNSQDIRRLGTLDVMCDELV
jgi:hypothetical protein